MDQDQALKVLEVVGGRSVDRFGRRSGDWRHAEASARTVRMPSAALLAASAALAAHSSVEHTSSEIGARTPISVSSRTNATQSKSPSPGGTRLARQSCL